MVVIEAFQYTLNTGVADVDDVICSMAGFGLGGFVKYLLDRIRRSVTKGKEAKICYVWESQRRRAPKGKRRLTRLRDHEGIKQAAEAGFGKIKF